VTEDGENAAYHHHLLLTTGWRAKKVARHFFVYTPTQKTINKTFVKAANVSIFLLYFYNL